MAIKDRMIIPAHGAMFSPGLIDETKGGPIGYEGPVARGELVFVLDVPFWASKEAKEKNRNVPGFVDYPVLTPAKRDTVFHAKRNEVKH
ncbi:hypothetical protein pEaSNUABM42_00184 [Erwinia phage pEa_SNUABM_42]|nr:hypothetical protein pEaSNUABM43_00185 [Erwinia phage pEa_SNUABM_43]QVW55501.1 hypothetical protein pEaSNUABM42_00184 [Erwinia phage pEa_SNUABM_42]